jgi:hypothetical protein
MTSQYRHRRTSSASTAFPNPLEPGEIAVNTANRQIAIGDAQSGVVGQPLPAIAVRYFDTRAQYVANDFVQNGTAIYRAKGLITPGPFNIANWDMMVGTIDPQYVAKAGDTMTGMLTLPATVPSVGTHATNKTYVDTQVATKSTVYSQTTPPAGVPDNTLWFESDSGILYIRYNDGDSTQWVVACPQPDTAQFIIRTGDTMLGQLGLPLTPTAAAHATSKSYVDAQLANKSSVISSDTPPPAPIDNTLWFESDTGLTYLRYNDGNGPAQWIGIADSGMGAVRYDFAQTLTPNAMAQARANAGVTKKNYIINGAMQVSQENGATAGTATTYFPVDQFFLSFGNAGTQTAQQVASPTPSGSPNRLRVTATVADASVAAGDNCELVQVIEGLRVADLRSGSASAKTVTLQFGVKAPAGTYCVSIRSNGVARSYVAEYVISGGEANTDVVKSATIVLDQAGTWLADNGAGLLIAWGLMVGSTFQTAANTWTAGNFLATANQFNFMGTAGNVFELFDVSLTEGATAPPFAVPDYASELLACQRYFYRRDMQAGVWFAVLQAYTTVAASGPIMDFPVRMRATPAVQTGGTPPWISNATGASGVINAGSYLATNDFLMGMGLGGAVFRAGDAVMVGTPNGSAYYLLSARL